MTHKQNPLDELGRDSGLLARYAEVRDRLTDLGDDDVARAGRLLANLDPDEVQAAYPQMRAVSIGVTGHGTLGPLVPALTGQLARHGLLLRPYVSAFDSYVFELGDARSGLYAAGNDVTVCVLDPAVVFDEIAVPWAPDDVAAAWDRKLSLIEALAAKHAAATHGPLVLNTVPLPARYSHQLVDHRSRAALGAAWRRAMVRLLELTAGSASVRVVDLDPLLVEGVPADNPRMDIYTNMHLSTEMLNRYAREVAHIARHTAGRTKKCLVVDLDDTVWGGAVGECGPDGIEVGEGRRGAAFTVFQRAVKQMTAQGVLLAAISKNDLDPVRAALAEHPRMTLREDDFVRVVANWRPKHDNLRELATTLNIGLDSFVFADDGSFECGLVRRELPEVAVVQLDDEPALHASRLLADGWFDVPTVTADDRQRPERYREEAARKEFLDGFDTLDAYLRELDLRVRLDRATEADIARVAQLTIRTNQFNLTVERLSEGDVRKRAQDARTPVFVVRSADRFGDNGLVGALLLHWRDSALWIDNFLLSCRVFGRGIEQACLAAVLRYAADSSATQVRGRYRAGAKNGKVADLYPRHGFAETAPGSGQFRHDLIAVPAAPDHIRLTADL